MDKESYSIEMEKTTNGGGSVPMVDSASSGSVVTFHNITYSIQVKPPGKPRGEATERVILNNVR